MQASLTLSLGTVISLGSLPVFAGGMWYYLKTNPDEPAAQKPAVEEDPEESAMKKRFEEWMVVHKRRYKDEEEKAWRYELFKGCVMRVNELNAASHPGEAWYYKPSHVAHAPIGLPDPAAGRLRRRGVLAVPRPDWPVTWEVGAPWTGPSPIPYAAAAAHPSRPATPPVAPISEAPAMAPQPSGSARLRGKHAPRRRPWTVLFDRRTSLKIRSVARRSRRRLGPFCSTAAPPSRSARSRCWISSLMFVPLGSANSRS